MREKREAIPAPKFTDFSKQTVCVIDVCALCERDVVGCLSSGPRQTLSRTVVGSAHICRHIRIRTRGEGGSRGGEVKGGQEPRTIF